MSSFFPNLDKSTYLTQGSTRTGTVMGEVVDSPQFWLPIETSPSPTKISYILPTVIVFGVLYIVFIDGKTR